MKGAFGLFRAGSKPDDAKPNTGLDHPVYAIGDVHGRLDLLDPLITAIEQDAARTAGGRKQWVFLGDYVDRGPESRGVLERIIALKGAGEEMIALKGNHDAVMLAFLSDPSLGPQWMDFGGEATLASYHVVAPVTRSAKVDWPACSQALRQALPQAHVKFLLELELSWRAGDFFFAHAGVNPTRALDKQLEKDLLWIRERFLTSRKELECVVVHGHTPEDEVFHDRRRIGVDTGAYGSGVLTAVKLSGSTVSFVQACKALDEDRVEITEIEDRDD